MRKFTLLLTLLCYICTSAQSETVKDTTDKKPELPSADSTYSSKAQYGVNAIREYNEAYYVLSRINNNIGLPPNRLNFQTPQATLESFITSCRKKNFEDAAYALNLNLLPNNLTKDQAGELAEKLYFVIRQRVKIDWNGLPDRPDGQIDIYTTANQAIAGSPRRSVVFGEVLLNDIDVVMRLQRVKYKDFGAFWLISANTVENIDGLYKEYGPRKLDRSMPDWARIQLFSIPIWKMTGTLILIFLCYFLGRFCTRIFRKLFIKSHKAWMSTIANRLAVPAGFAIGVLFFYMILNYLISFTGKFASTLYAAILIVVVCAITWFIMRLIDAFMIYVAENKIGDADPEENRDARMMMTYISVARRVITFIVIIIGITIIMSQFRSFEKLGISLLASAGLATVILGIAAQSTLGNIIAGIQIAITRPAQIGDTVIIEDEWGYVEDIRFTYMVVRTWDWRRLIVPLKDIVSKTFENWSMTSAHQIRPIVLYADYKIDVQLVRDYFEKILNEAEDWDEDNAPITQVVDMTENSIKIRCLCSAKDASSTWSLHCELREKLVRFIADMEDGKHLAKSRILINDRERSSESSFRESDKNTNDIKD